MSTNPDSTKVTLSSRGWVIQSIPFLVTLTALCLTMASVTSCRFLLSESSSPTGARELGLFRFVPFGSISDNACFTYRHWTALVQEINDQNEINDRNTGEITPDTEGLSTAAKAAQAGGILASLFGFTCTMLLFLSFCFQCFGSKAVWRFVLPILLLFTAVFQGITFAGFADDKWCKETCEVQSNINVCNVVTCSFNEGANRAFAAMMLYFFMGIGIIFYPRRTTPLFEFVSDHDEQNAPSNEDHAAMHAKKDSEEQKEAAEV